MSDKSQWSNYHWSKGTLSSRCCYHHHHQVWDDPPSMGRGVPHPFLVPLEKSLHPWKKKKTIGWIPEMIGLGKMYLLFQSWPFLVCEQKFWGVLMNASESLKIVLGLRSAFGCPTSCASPLEKSIGRQATIRPLVSGYYTMAGAHPAKLP